MKKSILYMLSLCALVSVSCLKEEMPAGDQQSENLVSYTFVGTFAPESKISIGAEDADGNYPLNWQNGDALTISKKAVNQENNKLGDASLSDGAETNYGVFNALSNPYEGEVILSHPTYSASDSKYVGGVLSGSVPVEQTGVNSHLGKAGLAYAFATMSSSDVPVNFELKYLSSFLKINLTTTEYSEYTLTGATLLFDEATGVNIAGTIKLNVTDETVTYADEMNYVKATLATPVTFGESQTLWFSVLPTDFAGVDMTIIVQMTNGTDTVTVPVVITFPDDEKYDLVAQNLYEFTVNVTSDDIPAWYEPVESRDLLGAWAYGPQNTYLKQQSNADSSFEIDVKARGDFSKVEEPAYYGLYTTSAVGAFANDDKVDGSELLCYINGDNTNHTYDLNKLVEIPETYKIKVNFFGKNTAIKHPNGESKKPVGRWAVVAIYNAEKEVIWSYMIWRYQSGYNPQDIDYGSFKLMDRNLGADLHYVKVLESGNKSAEENAKIVKCDAYFQWGRKDPFYWSNNLQVNYTRKAAATNIEASIVSPGTYFYKNSVWDWRNDDHSADLWGAASGKKTIYDPCPEGYKVPDKATMDFVISLSPEINTTVFSSGPNKVLAVDINGDEDFDDYWPYSGYLKGNAVTTWGSSDARSETNSTTTARYWSNVRTDDTSSYKSYILVAYESSTAPVVASDNRANALPIRCQKE